jgi:murein DD-endopeptidase MepM/ murein hydrolase activator NlpD
MVRILISLFLIVCAPAKAQLLLPIGVKDRANPDNVKLTEIGRFGLLRKARPKVPAHYHTGIDIKRPANNYANEPVYAAGKGKVISVREDGPFSQIIIEHVVKPCDTIWTVYEHILGIKCHVGDIISETSIIARFFNKDELNKYGWQFDHVHFEMMKAKPVKLRKNPRFPEYYYKTYNITCFTPAQLNRRMINPEEYFKAHKH